MDIVKSKLIPLLCIVYGLFAIAGIYIAVHGHYSKPEPLPMIDESANKPEQLEQAKRIMDQAQEQQPALEILSMFYKGWLLEYDYTSLNRYEKPLYDGDSFKKRLKSYNDTAKHIPHIYQDAVTALFSLSTGSLILIILMLLKPCYSRSALLAVFPVLVVFTCAFFGINYDPLEYCWIPFVALGGIIFFSQLIFSFRFGRPEHRTLEGIGDLMMYRRGLVLMNFGIFLLVGASLMTTGSISGLGHSSRSSFWLYFFGEEGVALIGFIAGILMVIPGIRYMRKKPSGKGGGKE